MSPPQAGDDCIALALAFARAPGQFPDLLHGHGRLPRNVTALLLTAAGTRLRDSADAPIDNPPGELRQAARFFIENVLLARNADHYRVLGVSPTASPDEIKEHHRLLIRLFHPDRQALPNGRSNAIATRINRAYASLRYPDMRMAYDLSLAAKRKGLADRPGYLHRGESNDAPDLALRMPPFVARHLPQFALGSVALLALLGVMLVYLDREPTGSIASGNGQFAPTPEKEPARSMPADLPPAVARALAGPGQGDLPPATEKAAEAGSLVTAGATRKAENRSPGAVAETQAPAPQPAAGAAPVAVDPSTVAKISSVPLRPEQLDELVASLARYYKRGDLENLLALFYASPGMARGDKKQIRAEYDKLFRNSEKRSLLIRDMAWSGDGKFARGEGHFQKRVLRKGERSPRVTSGTVTMEVIQRNGQPLIIGLYQKPDR